MQREREKERESEGTRERRSKREIECFFYIEMALQQKKETQRGALQRKNLWEDCR